MAVDIPKEEAEPDKKISDYNFKFDFSDF